MTTKGKSEGGLHVGLAPSYGKLMDGSVMKYMDDNLMLMIAATINDLEGMRPGDRSWDTVVEAFMQNPLLEPDGSGIIHRSDRLIRRTSADWKFEGAPDPSIVQEVRRCLPLSHL